MQTNNIIGILTKVSILSLCTTSMSCQYLCLMNFSTVAGRHGRSLTTSVTTTTMLNSIRSNRRLCLVPSSLPLQRKPFPSNLQSKLALLSTSTTGSASSTFQPPEPPGTKGTPIFPDIKILQPDEANRTENATRRNTDSNAVMVVTGANRGIGLQFVKSLLHHTTGTIVACCRSPETATHLHDLIATLDASSSHRIHLVPLDMTQQSSIENVGEIIREKYNRVDLLLNVAGILGDGVTTPGPERALSKMDRSWLETTMAVNVIGPVMLTKELLPLLTQQQRRGRPKPDEAVSEVAAPPRPNAIVANLSARVGSITDNGLGGWYSYRMSKTALNQATRTMALEFKRNLVWTVALHPGTTNTDLSKPFHKNVKDGSLFPVDFTVTQLLSLIDSMQEENSGGFYDWSGKAISF